MRRIRHRLQYLIYAFFRALLDLLPHRAAQCFGRGLGTLAYRLAGRERRIALANLAQALPALDADQRRRLARESFRQVGAAACETISLGRLTPGEMRQRLDVEGWEHLEAAHAGGRGAFLLTAHLGCWELAAYAVALRNGTCHMVAHPLSNPLFDRELWRARARHGVEKIDSKGAARRMYKILKKGGTIGIALDQRTRPRDAIEVPFFGRRSLTSPLVAHLSIMTGTPVVPLFVLPSDAPGRFRVVLQAPIEPCGEGNAAIAALTGKYLAALEAQIRQTPEQWMWFYRRWREADLASPLRSSLAVTAEPVGIE